jgi:hypothetical protein
LQAEKGVKSMPIMTVKALPLETNEAIYPDLKDNPKVIHLKDAHWQITVLESGMKSGNTSVMLRLDLPDGQIVMAETSAALWAQSTIMIKGISARFGYPID